jgi:hypothetical protein
MLDFHTVGGGYDRKASDYEKSSIPRKASGAPFGTVITRRSYLNDAVFVALFEGPNELVNRVREALANPVWGVWFGRKCCLPATPVIPSIAPSRQEAFDLLLEKDARWKTAALEDWEHQEETTPADPRDGIFYQSDHPVAFGQHHGPVPAPYQSRGIHHHRPV